jgi:hypothetical protein
MIRIDDEVIYENVQGRLFKVKVVRVSDTPREDGVFTGEVVGGDYDGHVFIGSIDRIVEVAE